MKKSVTNEELWIDEAIERDRLPWMLYELI